MCNIWLRSDGRVERKGGYRHTDSWHEWLQDNFYGGSATKRIVIKEPSLTYNDRDLSMPYTQLYKRQLVMRRSSPVYIYRPTAKIDEVVCPPNISETVAV